MNGALIRECTEEDLDAVCKMEQEWVKEDITYGQAVTDRKGFLKHLGPYFLLAEIETGVVGFAWGSVHTSEGMAVIPTGQTYFEVDAIYVTAEHRNSGIGGMLLDRLVEAARSDGVERFSVYTATKDLQRILRFYQRHTFRPWYVRMYK